MAEANTDERVLRVPSNEEGKFDEYKVSDFTDEQKVLYSRLDMVVREGNALKLQAEEKDIVAKVISDQLLQSLKPDGNETKEEENASSGKAKSKSSSQ